jgi:hypothetical protein
LTTHNHFNSYHHDHHHHHPIFYSSFISCHKTPLKRERAATIITVILKIPNVLQSLSASAFEVKVLTFHLHNYIVDTGQLAFATVFSLSLVFLWSKWVRGTSGDEGGHNEVLLLVIGCQVHLRGLLNGERAVVLTAKPDLAATEWIDTIQNGC